MTELSKRLSAIAAMVDHGARFADIGTDHGYLPIYLTEQGICPSSIAMDVKDGPLRRARTHVQEAGLERRITLRKSDGFEALKPGEADTAVIAGMGGLLMIRLLENGKETVRGMRQLLLSPQSEIGQVRRYLLEHGYRISREQMILEDGKYYVILEARPGSEEPWTYIEEEFGRHLLASGDPVVGAWLEKELFIQKTIKRTLLSAASERAGERLGSIEERIRLLEQGIARFQRETAGQEGGTGNDGL